jgi:alpha-tubulin suppressor-like RCC1 family protein
MLFGRRVLFALSTGVGLLVGPVGASWAIGGTLHAWGGDVSGQVSEAPAGSNFTAIAAGTGHGLALDTDGRIHAWGNDASGQVSGAPAGTNFIAIAAGEVSSLALNGAGSIVGWGADRSGVLSGAPSASGLVAVQLGAQGPAPGADPTTPLGSFGVALDMNGEIHAWGSDAMGQVTDAPTGTGFTAISCGGMHCLALHSGGAVSAWGWDSGGLVSDTPTGVSFASVAAGLLSSLAIGGRVGAIEAWGAGHGGGGPPPGGGYRAIASGAAHSLAIDASGAIRGWGLDLSGEVSSAPSGTGFVEVAAGTYWSLALQRNAQTVPSLTIPRTLALVVLLVGIVGFPKLSLAKWLTSRVSR